MANTVGLVVAPTHTDESIAYLEGKISEHRQKYQEYHYLEHYPQLIRMFGPLVCLWTMHFEAKHSFLSRL